MTTTTDKSAWTSATTCTYGIPKDPNGDPRDTNPCGQPATYKAIGGFGYCAAHADEVREHDEATYGPQEDEE